MKTGTLLQDVGFASLDAYSVHMIHIQGTLIFLTRRLNWEGYSEHCNDQLITKEVMPKQ